MSDRFANAVPHTRKAAVRAALILLAFMGGVGVVFPATLPYTMNLPCGATGAEHVGTYWISLPDIDPQINGSPVRTAEDLCALIPNATRVSQRFAEFDGSGTATHDLTYDCAAATCTAASMTPQPPEAGCCGSCFCVDPGEGIEVVVSAPSSFTISGSESPRLIQLPPGGRTYLTSFPFDSSVTTCPQLCALTGLPATGITRGRIWSLNGCTGVSPAPACGTAGCDTFTRQPGEALRLVYPGSTAADQAWFNPVNGDSDADGIANSADNCPTIANPSQTNSDADPRGNACDNCPTVSNKGQADTDADGLGDACDSCPQSPNPLQADADSDTRGDSCDNCPQNANTNQSDVDRDGLGDSCDACNGGGSLNVAIVDSASCANGGRLPTTGTGPTGSFGAYNYFTVPVGGVSLAQLGPGGACGAAGCDTVLLNVCSAGLSCTTAGLSAAQKTDLVFFVGAGHKLIIYDSECPGVDYSWLPAPFTSGPLSASPLAGTVSVAEENTLSTSGPGTSHFIDTSKLGGYCSDDQVQSANVLQSGGANWCVDMTAAKDVSGPVHIYSSITNGGGATGLVIYNGLDLDQSCGDAPRTLSACENLSKIWLQELQQPVDPACLPCTRGVFACDDVNPCTDDSFDQGSGTCVHTPNTAPCDDGDLCTQTDICGGGVCTGGNPVTCLPSDQCHVAGVCNPASGVCSNPNAPDGTACDDGTACTVGEACFGGVCDQGLPAPELCNGFDDDCDGTIDENCLGITTGGGEIDVPGGKATFGFIAKPRVNGGPHQGQLEFHDHATDLSVQGTTVESIVFSGNTATFSGACISTSPSASPIACTYTVTVQDIAEPGQGADTFTITFSPPLTQYGPAPISKGNIQVHVQ
ncbi:MAG TPA: thrombospondin type 3 repeat-containing protein [Candidatus Polarisedimenticolia bacterium]|nr:thrombospondin type 3 repeat-containing protein [Candidatus Polarisedimenticolia bacterium]